MTSQTSEFWREVCCQLLVWKKATGGHQSGAEQAVLTLLSITSSLCAHPPGLLWAELGS